MRILALDPGVSTGLVWLDTQAEQVVVKVETLRPREMLWDFLDMSPHPDVVVVEDYINRPAKASGFDHTWDRGATHRVIGGIEAWAWRYQIKLVFQQPSAKPPMFALLGLTYQKNKKDNHHMDALVHGYKYIYDNKLLPREQILGCLKKGRNT